MIEIRANVTDAGWDTIAFLEDVGSPTEKANARLIADAPELLEALQDALIGLEAACRLVPIEKSETVHFKAANCRAALAKAMGDNPNGPVKDQTVIVEVSGGVAHVKQWPAGVTVKIVDHDIGQDRKAKGGAA